METEERQREVDANYEAFVAILPSIIASHRDKYALMRHRQVVNFYVTAEDARSTGEKFYDDGVYSVQKVTNIPVDLGFFSHAVHRWHI